MDFSPCCIFSCIWVSTKNFRLQQDCTYLSSLERYSRSSNQNCWWRQAQEAILTLPPKSHYDIQESSKQNYYFKCVLWTPISALLTASDPSHNWRLAKGRFADRYITKSEKFCFLFMFIYMLQEQFIILAKKVICLQKAHLSDHSKTKVIFPVEVRMVLHIQHVPNTFLFTFIINQS